jgi:predicted outer membrane repeat protein
MKLKLAASPFRTVSLPMVAMVILMNTARGQTFYVTNTSNSGPGSLSQAISEANNGGGTILFSNVTGIITMSDTLLTNNITVDASAVPGGITINGNHANQIFYVQSGIVVMTCLTISNGYQLGGSDDGGAIFNRGSLTMNRCTLSGNSACCGGNGGGAIANEGGSLTVNECTFVGNSTDGYGGGIENIDGILTVNQCTFSQNSCGQGGGGIDTYNYSSSLVLKGTILAGNTASSSAPDLFMEGGTLTASYCLIGDGTDSLVTNGVSGNLVGTSAEPINALLGPLGNYGGPTPTMPLTRGSPAIDAGGTTAFITDQRGFPRVVGLAPDIGAYESGTWSNYTIWIWELLPATATVIQHAGTFDFDGDGQSNTNEWLAGTDPDNADSVFRVAEITRQGSDLLVTWTMGPGRTNALQATAGDTRGGYNTNNFSDIFTVTNTVGTTTNYLDTGAATNVPARYYRVRLVP